jgi:glycosyltransferase involved in cell wall biosynthesis
LIVDNVSTDRSLDIARTWAATDNRVIVKKCRKHLNPLDNWNRCLGHAAGDYIVFLHADDLLQKDYLRRCLALYRDFPKLGYVYCDKTYIDTAGVAARFTPFYRESGIIPGFSEARVNLLGWHVVPSQMLIRKTCMRAIGGYRFSDMFPVYLLNLGFDVGYLNAPLIAYRRHKTSITSQSIKDKVMITALYLTKMRVLNHFLPNAAYHLRELKADIRRHTAKTCLSTYAFPLLAENQTRLCEEYMALARGFCLDIENTPRYRFLEGAVQQGEWTLAALTEAWELVAPERTNSGAPYPLPEGAISISERDDAAFETQAV